MKSIIYYSFLFSSFLSIAVASEEAVHHEASVWDLKYPFINFIILLAILSKVVKPLREKFNKQADDVKSLMDSAAKSNKDAEERLNKFQTKIKNLDSELVKIVGEYESDAAQFGKNQSEETITTIARMKRDLENKLDGEKTELIDELNHDLVNKVVSSTKTTIKNNKDYQVKATQKIVSELR
ncbi:MAG: ATP synthase F0 subunit B [Bacteriovorax sp.]|nr:ATP synthase F0 subunit B [Bacteriovorax sp.]